MRIGIFDSGIGGLTVLKSMLINHYNHEYIYLGDNKNVPYGTKEKEELLLLAKNNIEFLLKKQVDIIIIACGTISSLIDKNFINQYNVPIIDLINPTVNYLKQQDYQSVALLATPTSIKSGKLEHDLIESSIQVNAIPCPLLVPMIESGSIDQNIIYDYIKDIKEDLIILGCTHYPIIQKEIAHFIKKPILNMGDPISILQFNNETINSIDLYFTKINDVLIKNISQLIDDNFTIHEALVS